MQVMRIILSFIGGAKNKNPAFMLKAGDILVPGQNFLFSKLRLTNI
jgi:hypothetical protein